jgi:multicomponent Na+:H+ antiporter subunit F
VIPSIVITLFDILVLISMALCLARMARGPSAADRMVAIDLLGLLVVMLMISHGIRASDEAVLDIVLVFSVIAFFGTVALARYLQKESDELSKK